MKAENLLDALHLAERLKNVTRHCYTSEGRHESVAEHSWRMTLMAYFMKDEFPEADIDKVIRMCIIHDLGEVFTGDIPTFLKSKEDEGKEEALLYAWVRTLPEPFAAEMRELYEEMAARESLEAKIYKAIDGMEAVLQHNESDIKTWSTNEYELNQVYAQDKAAFSEYLTVFRELLRQETVEKIKSAQTED